MSKRPSQNRSRQEELARVAEQAAQWLVALEDDPASEHEELAQWLLESPLHTQMFLRAAAIDRKGAALHPTVLERIMKRLEMEPVQNVLPLRKSARNALPNERRERFHHRWWPLGLAAGVVFIIVFWISWSGAVGWKRYATDIGEQRSITLQDGSVVRINTHSRIDVRYSDGGRDVRLVNGEALFAVHHDSLRPFRVHVGDAVVRAVGTQFNIYRRADDATVAVIEGIVQISRENTPTTPLRMKSETAPANAGAGRQKANERLAAGQAVTVKANGKVIRRETVDVARIAAWRDGHLVFERASLDDIVTEFNRYNRKPLLRVDKNIGDRHRYTAVFDATDPQTLLKFLATDPALELARQGDELVIRPR